MFLILISIAVGEMIYQESPLYTEVVPLDWIPEGEDLIIKIRKDRAEPLLLMGSSSTVYFEENNNAWNTQADVYDMEGWALVNPIDHTLRVNVYQFIYSENWQIGIYVYSPLSYEITYESSPSEECNAECNFHGNCFKGQCDCQDNYRGNSCRLMLNDMNIDQEYSFQYETAKWEFYQIPLTDGFDKMKINWEQTVGDAYLFIDFSPSSSTNVPSMFTDSLYIKIHGQNSESFSINSEDYWIFGIYCKSECRFSISVNVYQDDNSLQTWAILVIAFSVVLMCAMISVTVLIIRKCCKSATVVPRVSMETLFPGKKFISTEFENQGVCMICLDDFNCESDIRELHCKHIFHSNCIDSWVLNRENCPLCKGGIGDDTYQQNDLNLEEREVS